MTVLIAGGGLAGATAACLLGPEATLVERETGPHDKVCGEFISWEAQEALSQLGIDVMRLGAAPIDAVRLIYRATVVRTRLPGQGAGLSRRVLDDAVLARAVQHGAHVLRGHAVRRLARRGLEVDGIGLLEGERVLLATGKHDVRNARRKGRPEALIGLKMFYRLAAKQTAELERHVEVVLFPGGYAGLQLVESGLANLCLLIKRTVFDAAGGDWPGVIEHLARTSPHLAGRLDRAVPQLSRPAAIFRVPYGFVHKPAPADLPHLFRLGDQMGVIPSFSGDGMAIALHTAYAAAAAVSAETYHCDMRQVLHGQIGRAMLLHRVGQTAPGLLALAACIWPGALAWVARLTRVSGAARLTSRKFSV